MPTTAPDTARAAARHALTALQNGFREDYLRTWFTEHLGGTVSPTSGGLRLEALGVTCPGRNGFARTLKDWAEFTLATRSDEPLAAMVQMLESRDPWAQVALIAAATIETGGTWVPPQPDGGDPAPWMASHLYEISLYTVLGHGTDPLDATRNWLKAASRVIEREAA